MSNKLTEVDALLKNNHHYLETNDKCYFFGEYTAREGFGYSDMNHLIYNFKKSVERKGLDEYKYKKQAISQVSELLGSQIPNADAFTFVPIPPSKSQNDPLYDNRLVQALEGASTVSNQFSCIELVTQSISTEGVHLGHSPRPSPEQLSSRYDINLDLCQHVGKNIIIFDDVLTTGSHYKAVELVIRRQFPDSEVHIAGLFVARTVRLT